MVSTDASEREASKRLRQLSARDQSLQRRRLENSPISGSRSFPNARIAKTAKIAQPRYASYSSSLTFSSHSTALPSKAS
jgi:hypothetical protein